MKYILIPAFVAVLIPALLHTMLNPDVEVSISLAINIISLITLLLGLTFVVWSAFIVYGKLNTPMWDKPPVQLITAKPYEYVRNPMSLGMFIMLLSESVLFTSLTTLIWAVIFLVLSHILIKKVEEPSLLQRFGASYQHYCANTSRWMVNLKRKSQSRSSVERRELG